MPAPFDIGDENSDTRRAPQNKGCGKPLALGFTILGAVIIIIWAINHHWTIAPTTAPTTTPTTKTATTTKATEKPEVAPAHQVSTSASLKEQQAMGKTRCSRLWERRVAASYAEIRCQLKHEPENGDTLPYGSFCRWNGAFCVVVTAEKSGRCGEIQDSIACTSAPKEGSVCWWKRPDMFDASDPGSCLAVKAGAEPCVYGEATVVEASYGRNADNCCNDFMLSRYYSTTSGGQPMILCGRKHDIPPGFFLSGVRRM